MLRATRWRISICASCRLCGCVRGRAWERRGMYGLGLGGTRRSKRGSGPGDGQRDPKVRGAESERLALLHEQD
ncbi:hypothetical protein EV401DRAFT_1963071 [Pisolithus croceorrhizus]|nr:hypothetical protein EV401DRAFT_1963071 [Pisolithus croceorrhizus]